MTETSTTRIRIAALIVKDDRILLAEHEKNGKRYYLLPGGGMEYGESIEEAIKRELIEEAGLPIAVGDLLWTVDSVPPDLHRHVLNLIVEARALSEELTPTPDRVLRDIVWVPLAELERTTLFPDTRAEILDYLKTGVIRSRILGKRWR
jgi:ADP-ribose pyrophosphatase YjhB (NUDIX family)